MSKWKWYRSRYTPSWHTVCLALISLFVILYRAQDIIALAKAWIHYSAKWREKKPHTQREKFLLAIHNMKAKQRMCYCFNHTNRGTKRCFRFNSRKKSKKKRNYIAYLPMLSGIQRRRQKKTVLDPKGFFYLFFCFVNIPLNLYVEKALIFICLWFWNGKIEKPIKIWYRFICLVVPCTYQLLYTDYSYP